MKPLILLLLVLSALTACSTIETATGNVIYTLTMKPEVRDLIILRNKCDALYYEEERR